MVAVGAGVIFMLVLWVGLFARLEVPAGTRIDLVVPTYIATNFSYGLQVVITIGLLCAGISTLEGLLLALSTVISVDLYLGILGNNLLKKLPLERKRSSALAVGRASIVALGIVTFWLSWRQIVDPTGGSVAIFAQYGVYGLITASLVPLACGMFAPWASRTAVTAGSLTALAVYFLVAIVGWTHMSNNPAFLATCGIGAGWVTFGAVQLVTQGFKIDLTEPAPLIPDP
jgi:Na+/pantothenate symporter